MGSLGSDVAQSMTVFGRKTDERRAKKNCSDFQMPLHYPRYTKADYESMPEWRVDCLLKEYGLPVMGDAAEKRKFAIGAFLCGLHSRNDRSFECEQWHQKHTSDDAKI